MEDNVIPNRLTDTERSSLAPIDERLAQLRIFENDLASPDVDKALEIIHRVLDPRKEWLMEKGLVPAYSGSLQYKDPYNLDIDITFFSEGSAYPLDFIRDLEQKFNAISDWPRKRMHTDFVHYSLVKLKKGLEKIPLDTPFEYGKYEENYTDLFASLFLSSALLFEAQRPLFNDLQDKVRSIIAGHRWVREGVVFNLDEVIEIREERRKALQKD